MKVLFIMHPLIGHFHAMVPLAQALVDHGHDVAFATGERFGPIVKRVGFDHFPCGWDSLGVRNIFTELPGWPPVAVREAPPGIQQLWAFIQAYAPGMVDDLINLMQVWKPDVIVRDPAEFGSYITAELFDLPYASIDWAIYISTYGCTEPLNALRRRYGLPDDQDFDSFDRYLVLNGLPPSWQIMGDVPPVTHRFRMPPFDQSVAQELPPWVDTLPDQPTVYATLGTTFNQKLDLFQALIAALGTEAFNTIITVGKHIDPAQFHPLPPQVKIEQYIPQTLILPYCDAFIFHGGYNSLLSALWHGLPMVVMPLEAGDQQPTAQQCADLGVGVSVEESTPQPETIRSAIKTVLDQSTYRQRAQQLQREFEDLPPLSEAVLRLETLAKNREPQPNAQFHTP
ncbi:MAG: glycosyltransferase family 1 protein [Anaerolineae bacterium]|nr:glycosyltransferase family 1 protein [Anaerolineae bacterium]